LEFIRPLFQGRCGARDKVIDLADKPGASFSYTRLHCDDNLLSEHGYFVQTELVHYRKWKAEFSVGISSLLDFKKKHRSLTLIEPTFQRQQSSQSNGSLRQGFSASQGGAANSSGEMFGALPLPICKMVCFVVSFPKL